MLATYMRRMRNNNLEIRIVARKNFGGTTVSMIEIKYDTLLLLDIQSNLPKVSTKI